VQWATGNTDLGDPARVASERMLYNWMTDPFGDPLPGRWNIDPILIPGGFLPCTTDHTDPTDVANACNSQWPIPGGTSRQRDRDSHVTAMSQFS
jgi:hypothetical protein